MQNTCGILLLVLVTTCALAGVCVPKGKTEPPLTTESTDEARPIAAYGDADGIILGEPLAASTDINGDIFVADGSPARLMRIETSPVRFVEFQLPSSSPGFYPTDVAVQGFFVFAVDETGRTILRFDKDGAYRDVLLNFDELVKVRRVSPYGIGVDGKGRIAISDVENHQILLFDGFLSLDVAFGNFGSFAGQLDTPRGVSFTNNGDIVVADTGNKRIQFFTDTGTAKLVVPPEGAPNPLREPRRAVVDKKGKIYVADPRAGRVFVFDDEGHLVGTLRPEGADEFEPTDVEAARDGTLFVTDVVSGKLFVFKVM
jgi:DNA-binding beta-propeller fold protein YncE